MTVRDLVFERASLCQGRPDGTDYGAFIAGKQRQQRSAGPSVAASDVHPILHDWQNAVTRWAVERGRAALFEDCGLGKTFQQVEWARLVADRALIVAPLSVARQTVREAARIDVDVTYTREHPAAGDGLWITNYEMLDRIDCSDFQAVVLDESSILKNVDSKTRRHVTEACQSVPYRLACTATPAPNDVAEIVNHIEWLGLMPRNEALAAWFVHDDEGWRLKGHARGPLCDWMATWAVAMRRPSDIGWPDDGYDLPPLTVKPDVVDVELESDGQLFPTDLGGIGGRAKVRRETLDSRAGRAAELAEGDEQAIVWCALNDEASTVTRLLGDDAVNVEGSWSPDDKAAALEAFQDGNVRVLVTKPTIAGFGMNFQQCHRMVFCGLGDSFEQFYQAVRRCWRYGQAHPVEVHVVVSELETQIVDNVAAKAEQAGWLVDEIAARVNLNGAHDG